MASSIFFSFSQLHLILFLYYFDLIGLHFEYSLPGSYFFIFDFILLQKSQPSSKLISHSFKVFLFSSPIFLCLYFSTDLHQQFKPDDIMIASLCAFLLQPYLSCLALFPKIRSSITSRAELAVACV